MSTTIHMHIEVKKDGKWLHYATTSASHDRLFFDLVAGIYGVFPCVVSPKGLPEDLSEVTALCYQMDIEDNYGVHSEGWLNTKEICLLQRQLRDLQPEKNPLETELEKAYFHCYIHDNAIIGYCGFEDSRLVFWFEK